MNVVSLADYEAMRAERDTLQRRLEAVTQPPMRDAEREATATAAILGKLPRALRGRVVIAVRTIQGGDLYATATVGERFVGFPQSNLGDDAFPRCAAALFVAHLFAADVAASIPSRRRSS